MKLYTITREDLGVKLSVCDIAPAGGGLRIQTTESKEIMPGRSQAVINHSPDGYEYGYRGSGPAQLALAILLDALPSKEAAVHNHAAFKDAFLANEKRVCFEITEREILRWLTAQVGPLG